jgi:catalase (peroxidase I)
VNNCKTLTGGPAIRFSYGRVDEMDPAAVGLALFTLFCSRNTKPMMTAGTVHVTNLTPGSASQPYAAVTPDGRLPAADAGDGAGKETRKGLRAVFGRMGFDDRDIVALSGAHALGGAVQVVNAVYP